MTTTVSALDMPFEEAISYLRNKTNMTSEHYTDVFQRANATGFAVAGAGTKALVEDFRREVEKALETGTSLNEFRKSFDDIVARHGWAHTGTPGWRATIIYETNLGMAYSAGRYAQQTEPETLAAFPYWQYLHSGAQHPRLEHQAWDGLVLRADDPFWDSHYPPNGWRCGCRVAPVSERGLSRQGKSAPDTAPPLDLRPWTNPKTGEIHMVPRGVDPGFDYNPGKEWRGAAAGSAPAIDLPRLDQQLHDAQAAWAQSLSQAEVRAIMDYKGADGFLMNERLRGGGGGRTIARLDEAIETLTQALDRARLPQAVKAWRGVSAGEFILPGQTVTIRGFGSASIDQAMAEEMAGGGQVFEFTVPKGYRAAYVNRIPWQSGEPEYELLLKPGARLKVVEMRGDRIIAEVIEHE